MPPILPDPIARAIEAFGRMPGIGPKSAQRLAFHLLRQPRAVAEALSQAVLDLKDLIVECTTCFNLGANDPCAICADVSRDRSTICVVEAPLDVIALEKLGAYRGLYHVLHGSFSPMDGVLEDDLRVADLVQRVRAGGIAEVIVATNATVEGEATANLVRARLQWDETVRVSRLAQGLPIGSDIEYADDYTLTRAFQNRTKL
ncbi:MAG: recombination mediator RecR [Chloroflexota bacterium]|jgi:recombination protein RecR